MKPNQLEVGLLLWWKGDAAAQPIIITYVNHKNNCFRFIGFSDNTETENLRIIRDGNPTHLLEQMSKIDKIKVHEYFSRRKNVAQEKINKSLDELHNAQSRHDHSIKEMNEEFALEEAIKKILAKYEEKLPTI